MFKKLFSKYKPLPVAAVIDSSIHQPLQSGALGLQERSAQQIAQIAQTSGVSQSLFDQHFLPVINKLLFTFQSLPASSFATHDHFNGLSDLCLLAGLNALKIRRGMVLPPGVRTDLIDSQRALWSFAVFCAGLTLVIRDNLTQLQIEVSDDAQDFKVWNVTAGPLGDSSFFRFRKAVCDDEAFASACASTLMTHWIETDTKNWLVKDKQVFGELFGLLNNNQKQCKVLQEFLMTETVFNNRPAEAETAMSETAVLLSEATLPQASEKPPNNTDFSQPFFVWLFKEIASGGLILNTTQSVVHTVEGGLFIKKSIARKFAKTCQDDSSAKQTTLTMLSDQCNVVSYTGYDEIHNGFQFVPDQTMLEITDANPALIRQSADADDAE